MKTKIFLTMLAAVVLLAACKGKTSRGEYEFVNNHTTTAEADSSAKDNSVNLTPKLVKTAEMNFKVKNVQQVSESIAAVTKQYGGMVIHHKVQSTAGQSRDVHISNDSIMRIAAFNTIADMTVKVPSEKLEDFMTKVGHMGIYVNISLMDIEDRSLDYLSARLKLKDRQELVSQQKQGKIKIKNPGDVLSLKDDMVDAQIGNLKTDDAVKYSVVSLVFYQSDTILKENIANDDPSSYNIPLFQRLGLAFSNGWFIFIDVVVGLANLWVFILAGLSVWMVYRFYSRKRREITHPMA
ncbi:MAG: DUF4349 domain-containing protein [Mucilaginibacter sp.]